MKNNLLKALYLDWFENGPLRESLFEVRHVPFPNQKQVAYPRFYQRPCCPAQWSRHHLFFAVNPRLANRDSRSVSHVVALFVDIDRNDRRTMFLLREFQPRVSAVISSGRGLHAYWFLQEPVPASQTGDVPRILRGIARRLDADPAVVSPAQLLRIPRSINPKNNALCSEIFVDERIRYEVDEFSEFQDPVALPRIRKHTAGLNGVRVQPGAVLPLRFVRDLQRNPSFHRLWSRNALDEFRSGSEHDFALSMKLAWRDYSPNEIATILLHAPPYPKKYPRTPHYLSTTVAQASIIVEQAKGKRIDDRSRAKIPEIPFSP